MQHDIKKNSKTMNYLIECILRTFEEKQFSVAVTIFEK
jgi:hypothetical protein